MAVKLSYLAGAGWQFFSNNGVPLSGGLLYTYLAGTTTPQTTYTSSTGSIANSNPVVLDSAGRTPQQIWLTEGLLYKFVLRDSAGVLIQTNDNIPSVNDQADLANSSDPTKGDALVGFRQSNAGGNLAGSVGSTVHKKLQEIINVRDFGAVGDNTTNDSAAFQAAVTALANTESGVINVPPGAYYIATPVALASNVKIQGAGIGMTTLRCAKRASSNAGSTLSQAVFTASGVDNISIYDVAFDGDVASGLNSDNLDPQGVLSFDTSTNITVERCTFTKFFASLPIGYVYSDATYELGAIFMYDCSVINVKNTEYLSPTYGNLTMILECDNITLDGLKSTFAGNGTTIINETPINVWGVTTSNVTIENCYFKDTAGSAINLAGTGNFIVQNNRFDTCNSPIDLSDENWVDKATHPDMYNIIVQNNILIDPQGPTPAIQIGDTRAAENIRTHEVIVANNQIQMTTSVTNSIVVGNSNFVTITGNTCNGGSITSLYNDVITINNNVLNGRNAAGTGASGVAYYCRLSTSISYGYIKGNLISYWEDGAIQVYGFFGAPYTKLSITDNEFMFSTTPTNGQYITVTPSGGNPAYRPGILMINNNRLNTVPYVPFRGTDTAISADTLLFGTLSVKVGSFTRDMTLASGTQVVTGVGFQPRTVLFLANVPNTGQASIGFGALPNTATGPFDSFSLNSRTATSAGTFSNNSGTVFAYQGASDYYTGNLSTFDSDGFTMSWVKTGTTTGTLEVNYIAFQ
jgi:hypothetical protein